MRSSCVIFPSLLGQTTERTGSARCRSLRGFGNCRPMAVVGRTSLGLACGLQAPVRASTEHEAEMPLVHSSFEFLKVTVAWNVAADTSRVLGTEIHVKFMKLEHHASRRTTSYRLQFCILLFKRSRWRKKVI